MKKTLHLRSNSPEDRPKATSGSYYGDDWKAALNTETWGVQMGSRVWLTVLE